MKRIASLFYYNTVAKIKPERRCKNIYTYKKKTNIIFSQKCFRNVAEKLLCFLNSRVLAECRLLRSIAHPHRPDCPLLFLFYLYFSFILKRCSWPSEVEVL